ncbi:hypothetical protein [Ferruginibacter sp.]
MKVFFFAFFLFLASFAFSQSNKELKEIYKAARDSSSGNYIILKSKEKKEIKSINVYKGGRGAGKAVLANGEKIKFIPGDIIEYQDEDGFYKVCIAIGMQSDGEVVAGQNFAKRKYIANINIYTMSLNYSKLLRKENESPISVAFFYCIETNNDGNLVALVNDTAVVNKVESLVKKSSAAIEIINELKSKYGKFTSVGYAASKLLDAVMTYNKDAAEGKLMN